MQALIEIFKPFIAMLQQLLPQLFLIFKGVKGSSAEVRSIMIDGEHVTLIERVRRLYSNMGGQWNPEFNIIGIQDESGMKQDVWNDYIIACYNTNDGWKFMACKSTTNPSVYWTSKKNQRKAGFDGHGAAHMRYGFHKNIWVVGKHRGKYLALVQHGNKVHIWRDANENFKDDDEAELRKMGISNKGYFGINLHHGGNARKIGLYSAGCQVINRVLRQRAFMKVLKKNKKYQQNSKAKYSYLLIEINDVPADVLRIIREVAK